MQQMLLRCVCVWWQRSFLEPVQRDFLQSGSTAENDFALFYCLQLRIEDVLQEVLPSSSMHVATQMQMLNVGYMPNVFLDWQQQSSCKGKLQG